MTSEVIVIQQGKRPTVEITRNVTSTMVLVSSGPQGPKGESGGGATRISPLEGNAIVDNQGLWVSKTDDYEIGDLALLFQSS